MLDFIQHSTSDRANIEGVDFYLVDLRSTVTPETELQPG
jgi:hypothetical protein